MFKLGIFIFSSLFLIGCINKPVGEFAGEAVEQDAVNSRLSLEPIYQLSWSDNSLTIFVKDTGCTYSQHFSVNIIRNEVTVVRNQQDYCRAMPTLKRIVFNTKLPDTWLLKNPLKPTPDYMQIDR